jgi:hypothetical protein
MTTSPLPASEDGKPPEDGRDQSAEPAGRVGALRGASVQVDAGRLGQVAVALVLLTLAVLTIAFIIVGVHKNEQTDRLHNQGVPVIVTVTGCLGLLGGSGSNAAGYSCHGTYTLDGHRYTEVLPGSTFHAPGATLAAIAVPGDPALVSPVSLERTQHSSGNVFILPVVLGLLFLLLAGVVLVVRRRAKPA